MSIFDSLHFSQPEFKALELCAVDNAHNIGIGRRDTGDHIKRIQAALEAIMGVDLSPESGTFGQKTAKAVLDYKESKTPPIRQPWQTGPDDPIVGIRTIRTLDRDMKAKEGSAPPEPPKPIPNAKFDLLLYFSGFVDPGGEDISNENPGEGFAMLRPMRAMTTMPGSKSVFRAWQGSLMIDKGIEAAVSFLQTDFDAGRVNKVVVYGFSAGGSNALDLGRRLEELNAGRKDKKPLLKIDLLITVDAAERSDRPRKITRSVAGSIFRNLNFFQTTPSTFGGARGDTHTPVTSSITGSTPLVHNFDKSFRLTSFAKQSRHGQMEAATVPDATASILAEISD